MRSKEVDIESIKYQLGNGYIDITDSYPDENEFNFIKSAVELYEKYLKMQKCGSKNIALVDMDKFFRDEFVSKKVIRDKIEELEDKFDFFAGREHAEWQDGEFDGDVCDDIALQIKVLKDLLEGE